MQATAPEYLTTFPAQVRAVIVTKPRGVGPHEQLTWFYNTFPADGSDNLVVSALRDLPSQ